MKKVLNLALLISFLVTIMVPLTGIHIHKLASVLFVKCFSVASDKPEDRSGDYSMRAGWFWKKVGWIQIALRYQLRMVDRCNSAQPRDYQNLARAYNNIRYSRRTSGSFRSSGSIRWILSSRFIRLLREIMDWAPISKVQTWSMLDEKGTIIGDVVVFRMGEGKFWISTLFGEHGVKGKIVLVSSNVAYLPQSIFGGYAHYAASKGGVISMTTEIAKELKRYDIMVNSVAPGGMMCNIVSYQPAIEQYPPAE